MTKSDYKKYTSPRHMRRYISPAAAAAHAHRPGNEGKYKIVMLDCDVDPPNGRAGRDRQYYGVCRNRVADMLIAAGYEELPEQYTPYTYMEMFDKIQRGAIVQCDRPLPNKVIRRL
ncbi:MAG: hypothetical protein FWG65_13115 [Turicibacter sp.]|nr:hypothetical protein [Turicibacter sp.]